MPLALPDRIIVIATRNRGKAREFGELLGARFERILDLDDIGFPGDVEEDGSSFAENARLKAVECSKACALPVLADDSGLEVFSLGGRPGIHSARYAGPGASDGEKIAKLLAELGVAASSREARFVCALALARSGKVLLETVGECRGRISEVPSGSGGFGYDPVFLLPELARTYAELPAEEKNRYSHRARAVDSLLRLLGA